jgi:vacuolar-type H+-ATPase subunit F/Vma7
LAGVTHLYHPDGDEALADTMRKLLTQKDIGIVVLDSANLTLLSDRLRSRIADSITPTVLGIGTEEDNTLRESIKSALGVDLWK